MIFIIKVCQSSRSIVGLQTQDSDAMGIKEDKKVKEVRIHTIYKLLFYSKHKSIHQGKQT